jgi:lipid-binding SYLF domain-containing protein
MRFRVAVLVLAGAGMMAAQSEHEKRLIEAADVFQEVMNTPDKGIPQELLDRAQCVVIVPGLKKGAFIVGAKYGRGFMSCRTGGVGWSAPGAVRVEGGSFGLQIGGSETDVIMLVMNERGATHLMSSRFTLGGDAAVAAGPVGRVASAETDAYLRAELLTWSRSRGAFAGISLQGATLRQDSAANKDLYGQAYRNRDIVTKGIKPPKEAAKLLGLLNKYSSRH